MRENGTSGRPVYIITVINMPFFLFLRLHLLVTNRLSCLQAPGASRDYHLFLMNKHNRAGWRAACAASSTSCMAGGKHVLHGWGGQRATSATDGERGRHGSARGLRIVGGGEGNRQRAACAAASATCTSCTALADDERGLHVS